MIDGRLAKPGALLYASAGRIGLAEAEDMRIDLATEPGFELGPMRVSPETREVFAPSGREVLEPRVMMVLVALARARDHTVSRDALIQSCWDGLAVGDDAINRVIGRLRKLAAASGAFAIETITKVGYRLTEQGGAVPQAEQGRSDDRQPHDSQPGPSRQVLLVATMVAVIAGGAVAAWRLTQQAPLAVSIAAPSPADALVRSGRMAIMEHSPQQVAQGVAQLQEATMREPRSAEAWGALALGYAVQMIRIPPEEQAAHRKRIEGAIARALALQPAQPEALAAQANMTVQFGNWLEREQRELAAAGPQNPRHARFLASVGRMSESLALAERAAADHPDLLYPQVGRATALWALGRVDEADRATADVLRLWPGNYLAFFIRVYFLLYAERPADALALASDRRSWPTDIPPSELQLTAEMAQAVLGRDKDAADRLIARYDGLVLKGRGYNENAIRIAAALGRPDDAFRYAERLYLLPVGQLPEARFQGQNNFGDRNERLTELLFQPPMDRLHGDPRFLSLLQRIGMVDYWKKSGSVPDFCLGHAAACRRAGIAVQPVSAP